MVIGAFRGRWLRTGCFEDVLAEHGMGERCVIPLFVGGASRHLYTVL